MISVFSVVRGVCILDGLRCPTLRLRRFLSPLSSHCIDLRALTSLHHHSSLFLEEPAEALPRHHAGLEEKKARERQIEILRTERDKFVTQSQFLQSRVSELRRTATRETQRYDQLLADYSELQKQHAKLNDRIEKLIDCLNDREVAFDVPVKKSSWIALRVLPSSHTNPVFVVVGDKPFRASRKSAEWCLKSVDQCWSQKERAIRPSEKEEARKAYDLARRAYRKIREESADD